MYLNQVSDFANFLSKRDFTLQEILNHLLRVVLLPIEPTSIVIGTVNENNEIEALARAGISKSDKLSLIDVCNLDGSFPSTDAIRFGKFVWINTLPDWGEEYQHLKRLPADFSGKSYITLPIYQWGTPVSTMAIFSKRVLTQTEEMETFLNAIAGIFSLYFYRKYPVESELTEFSNLSSSSISEIKNGDLTSRQNVILRLMAEDRTNLSISDSLGYSESTIRQEIMHIFAKLGCSTRKQAADIFRSWNKA